MSCLQHNQPSILGVDHITYCVRPETIEAWFQYHTKVRGGQAGIKIDDVKPDDPRSSMMLWTINFGSFGVALVSGLDRSEKSQVTLFVERHGDHSIQHVAYLVDDLKKWVDYLAQCGVDMRGEILVRKDERGPVKQVFARGYEEGDPAESMFEEYVERPEGPEKGFPEISFSQRAGIGFYDQVQEAHRAGDTRPLINIKKE